MNKSNEAGRSLNVFTNKSNGFCISENFVFLMDYNSFFFEEKKNREIVAYNIWDRWKTSRECIITEVWEYFDEIEVLNWYLIIKKRDTSWVLDDDLKVIFFAKWDILDIKENKKWFWLWLLVSDGLERTLCSNLWYKIKDVPLNIDFNDWFATFDYWFGNVCYNQFWTIIFDQDNWNYFFKEDCACYVDKSWKWWCSLNNWKIVFDCNYDDISIRENYIIWLKEWTYFIYSHFFWYILDWEFDDVTVQSWFVKVRIDDRFLLYDFEWKKVKEWNKYMFIDDSYTLHTLKNGKEFLLDLTKKYTNLFFDKPQWK